MRTVGTTPIEKPAVAEDDKGEVCGAPGGGSAGGGVPGPGAAIGLSRVVSLVGCIEPFS